MIANGIKASCRTTVLTAIFSGLASFLAVAQSNNPNPLLNTVPGEAQGADISTTSPFLMEPDAQIKGDRIKEETFKSLPAGQNQNWNLDIGRFQPKINDDPNGVAPDLEGDYSGMRFRLPLRGGLRQ